jgi:hypothetical protein
MQRPDESCAEEAPKRGGFHIRRVRPRISLLTAFLLTTIVGLAMALFQLWREVGPLRAEVRQIRNEVGRLSIEDTTKIHAIQVRTNEPLFWKWRVWVPDHVAANLFAQWGNVPRAGLPTGCKPQKLRSGEQWITLRVLRDVENKWVWQLETDRSSGGLLVKDSDIWWTGPPWGFYAEGVQYKTAVEPAETPFLILQRHRTGPTGDSSRLMQNDAPMPGFIIWLQRQ